MTLTPQDIQTKQFHVRFRGFDVEEVDAFLERIAEEFLILIQENKQLRDRVDFLEKDIEKFKDQEKKFQDAILSAHAIADEMKEKSRKESEQLITGAKEEVDRMHDRANEEITGLEATIVNLKDLKNRVHDDVRNLLESYLERLEEVTQGVAIDYVPEMESKPLSITQEPGIVGEEKQEPGLEAEEEQKFGFEPEEEQELGFGEEEPHDLGFEDHEGGVEDEIAMDEAEAEASYPFGSFEEMEEPVGPAETDTRMTQPELFSEISPKVEIEDDTAEDDNIIPDIDGEMLFTLDDPLDKLESDLTAPDKEEEEEKED